jgi:hypothetical protein
MRGPEAPLGRVNIRVAWWRIGTSMAVGAVMGLLFRDTYTRQETEARLLRFVAQRRDARLAAYAAPGRQPARAGRTQAGGGGRRGALRGAAAPQNAESRSL